MLVQRQRTSFYVLNILRFTDEDTSENFISTVQQIQAVRAAHHTIVSSPCRLAVTGVIVSVEPPDTERCTHVGLTSFPADVSPWPILQRTLVRHGKHESG